ncbi:MAG: hypothetical protein ACJ8M4_06670 [Chthoniobacterales bacterium]
MNKITYIVAFSLMIVILGLSSCSDARRHLTGKWRLGSDANPPIWEFRENGGLTMGNIQGRYSLGDRGRIKIETGSSTAVYGMSLAGDQLTLKDPRGTKLDLVRVKP